jgi:hypothetical protein
LVQLFEQVFGVAGFDFQRHQALVGVGLWRHGPIGHDFEGRADTTSHYVEAIDPFKCPGQTNEEVDASVYPRRYCHTRHGHSGRTIPIGTCPCEVMEEKPIFHFQF